MCIMTTKTENKKSKKNQANFSLTSLGWELALPIFGGVLIGYKIDRILINSQYIFTIALLIIGIIAGYYNLYKLIDLEVLRTKAAKRNSENQGES